MILFVKNYFEALVKNWKEAFQKKVFKITLIGTAVAFMPLVFFLTSFFNYLEQRPGCDLKDPILSILPSVDLSHLIFLILYVSLIIEFFYIIRFPWLIIRGCQVFIVVHFIRTFCLYYTPLNPPQNIIILQDPFLQFFIYNKFHSITKDLFFSGHTATMIIFLLLSWNSRILRYIFGITSVVMALFLLIQHCHYTIDIIGGVVFGFLSFNFVRWYWTKMQLPLQ